MVAINTPPMSLAEFEALLDRGDERRLELWPDGTLHEKGPVTAPHALIEGGLVALLEGSGRVRGRAFTELNVPWGERLSYRPDVAFYPRERLGELRTADGRDWILHPRTPPDLAVEIRSPSETIGDQLAKCSWYVQHGVKLAWLVDFEQRVVYVVQATVPGVSVHRPDDDAPIGLDLRAADVFALLEP
jgi:Uma2 family endonuclease